MHALGPSQGPRGSPRARSGSSPPPPRGPCCARPWWGHRPRPPSQSGPPQPPREAQQVDARVTPWLALSLPSPGGGVTALCSRPKPECRVDCPVPVPCARWESPWALEVSQRSCHLWSIAGASCQVPSSGWTAPAPSAAGSPLGSSRRFPGCLCGWHFPESWRPPCPGLWVADSVTCHWSASLRVCVDTSIPLTPSEKLDSSSPLCSSLSTEGPSPALLCPPGASSWTY